MSQFITSFVAARMQNLTPYERWQLANYGDIIPEGQVIENEDREGLEHKDEEVIGKPSLEFYPVFDEMEYYQ